MQEYISANTIRSSEKSTRQSQLVDQEKRILIFHLQSQKPSASINRLKENMLYIVTMRRSYVIKEATRGFLTRRPLVRANKPKVPPPIVRIRNTDISHVLDTANRFNLDTEEELKVVLLRKKRYVSEFTVFGQLTFKIWKMQLFQGGSKEENFLPNSENADEILFYRPAQVANVQLNQVFRDNALSNCVFVPIISTINRVIQDVSRNTKKKYEAILANLFIEQSNYPDGVPQDELIALAKRLNIRLELNDVLGQKILETGSKASKIKIKLKNTRANHVDNYTDEHITYVTQDEITEIYKEKRKAEEFYIIYNNTDKIKTLKTLDGTFKVKSDDEELIKEMDDQIFNSSIDALKYHELNEFIKEGRIISSTLIQFKPFDETTRSFDMKNAYAQYEHCGYYEGFPYILHQYRPVDKIVAPGIYEFSVDISTPLSRLFGLYADSVYILPSPEIKWWINNGVELTITKGVWGSTKHLKMSPEFVRKKLYNKWTGKLSAPDNFRFTKHTFPADLDFVQHVKSMYPHTFYYGHKREAMVKIPHKHVYTNHHIYAFFTAYTRINMLNILKTIPIKDIHGVQLDAIFTNQEIKHPLFREKELPELMNNTGTRWYWETTQGFYEPHEPIHELITENSFLSGQGGSGKTYSILNDKGYINPLYVTPCHELGKKMNTNYQTIHKLIGLKCDPLYIDTIPNVILIDEVTQLHEDYIHQAFKQYPHSLILLAGDIDARQHYQCRGGYTNNYMPIYKPTIPIINYTTDYRSQTETLKEMKLHLRKQMQKIFTDGGIEDTRKIRDYIKAKYPVITKEEANKLFQPNDVFLYSTNKTKDSLSNPCHGVHAFQGQTIEPPSKIFITMDWFEYAMPYTAISRARSHEQIIFVK